MGAGNPNWKKGMVSPNPDGRKPGEVFSLTALVRKELQKAPPGEKKTYAQQFIEKLFQKALKQGDVKAQKLIWNYMDGLPAQNLELTGKDGAPLTIKWHDPSDDTVHPEEGI